MDCLNREKEQGEKNESRGVEGRTEIREEGKNKWKVCSLHCAAGVSNPSHLERQDKSFK